MIHHNRLKEANNESANFNKVNPVYAMRLLDYFEAG